MNPYLSANRALGILAILIGSQAITELPINYSTTFRCLKQRPGSVWAAVSADAAPVEGSVTVGASSVQQAADRALLFEEYPRAESLYLRAINETSGGDKNVNLLDGLGESYLWQGKFDLANKQLTRAAAIGAKNADSKALEYANVLDDLSWLYLAIGKDDKAVDVCQRAIEIRRKEAPGSIYLAESIEHLSTMYDTQGLFQKASDLLVEAIGIRRAAQDANVRGIADDTGKLAVLAQKEGNPGQAQKLFAQELEMKQATQAVLQPFSPHPYTQNIEFNFSNGAPNCTQTSADGKVIQSITANGVTVRATVVSKPNEFVKTTRAELQFINNSNRQISVLPQPPIFLVVSPKMRYAQKLDDQELAAKVEKKGQSKAGWINFWGSQATTTVTTTGMNMGGGYGYGGPYGYMPPVFVGRDRDNRSNRGRNNGYYQPGQISVYNTQVPDWQARARAMEKAQAVTDKSAAAADAIRQNALASMDIPPGQMSQGTLDFDQSKFRQAILRVPVGNAVFVFTFDRDGR
jgi:tetratricopeptide (TPR) repeat protein